MNLVRGLTGTLPASDFGIVIEVMERPCSSLTLQRGRPYHSDVDRELIHSKCKRASRASTFTLSRSGDRADVTQTCVYTV